MVNPVFRYRIDNLKNLDLQQLNLKKLDCLERATDFKHQIDINSTQLS